MANSDSTKPETRTDPAISRRDFLRRAGVEAATTGTKLVPGAAIAQKVLGISTPVETATMDSTETSRPNGLAERFAAWRRRRSEGDSASK